MKLYRLNEKDWYELPYVFRSAEDLEKFCDDEEIEDRECEEIEVSDDVVRLMVDTADTILDMGESWQDVFDGVVYDYLNDTVESLVEYLREAEFDDLAEKWEHVMPSMEFLEALRTIGRV